MNDGHDTKTTTGPPTAPENFMISLKGFDSEERADRLGRTIGAVIHELSRTIDLRDLDGITVADDYKAALLGLDRGLANLAPLTPTEDVVVGVAMTPAVIRDGNVKSHIVFNATYLLGLEDFTSKLFPSSLHNLAHECAHVELTSRFNASFPNVILQRANKNIHDAFRWQVISACWDEYGATRIAAGFGRDPTSDYEDTFIASLKSTRSEANELIKLYREHGDASRIMAELYKGYGNLLKYASYHLGNLDGFGVAPLSREKTAVVLQDHWFATYFSRLEGACRAIWDNFGNWADQTLFEAIGDIVDDVVREGGAVVEHRADGTINIRIPYSVETIPGIA